MSCDVTLAEKRTQDTRRKGNCTNFWHWDRAHSLPYTSMGLVRTYGLGSEYRCAAPQGSERDNFDELPNHTGGEGVWDSPISKLQDKCS